MNETAKPCPCPLRRRRAAWFAGKDAGGKWVITHVGQGIPNCGENQPFDFPTDWISHCIDASGNTVERAAAHAAATEGVPPDVYAPNPLGPLFSSMWISNGMCYDMDILFQAADASCDVLLDSSGTLIPKNGGLFSGYATLTPPSLNQCKAAPLSADPIAPNSDLYMCFKTNLSKYGFFVARRIQTDGIEFDAEVTNQQYALCVAAGKCSPPKTENVRKRLTERAFREHPVVGVDWEQAEAYCQWIDGHLPTEAQWEKTARGPESNLYPWGEGAPTCELGNFNDCIGQTNKVDEYPQGKSYYEVLGTVGNVFEWVEDWYQPQYYRESPDQNPLSIQISQVCSVRGSSYSSPIDDLRPSKRFYLAPDQTRTDLGFRCAIEAPTHYPPFCETSVYQPESKTPGLPGSSETENNISSKVIGRGCGFATADIIANGPIQSVEASGLKCEIVDGTRIYCYGPDSAAGIVTVCVREQETLQKMLGTCPPGYTPDPNDPTRPVP